MRVIGAMMILPIIAFFYIAFITLNIAVAVLCILSIIFLIERLIKKRKSPKLLVAGTAFIIFAIILGALWSFVLYPDFFFQKIHSISVGKEVAAIEYYDTKSVEKYLEDGWMLDEKDSHMLDDLLSDDDYNNTQEKIVILELLLEHGYNVNTPIYLGDGESKKTLLTVAVLNKNYEAIKLLIEYGGDINDLVYEDGTLIHKIDLSYGNGNYDILLLLLVHDIDLHKVNSDNVTGIEHLQSELESIDPEWTPDYYKLKELIEENI